MITRFKPVLKSTRPEFHFKGFQRHDYACGALHPGFILGHDTGGGKTAALYVMALLKAGFERDPELARKYGLQPKQACLIVAPGDLHAQIALDAKNLLRILVTVPIDSQETFLRLSTINPVTGARELPPGFYITSFTQLSSNGVAPFPKFGYANHTVEGVAGMMESLMLTERDTALFFDDRAKYFNREYEVLRAQPDSSARELEAQWKLIRLAYEDEQAKAEADDAYNVLKQFAGPKRGARFLDLSDAQRAYIRLEMVRWRHMEYRDSIGQTKTYPDGRKVKCVYSPSLVDYYQDTFAHVSVDEAVKMKGEETKVGLGVRQLNPRTRTVLTATPIKNRLPDIFRLAWWAAGGNDDAYARWPYPDETAAREEFADEFMITERNLTKEEESETNQRFVKRTPQVCNIHRLWKLLAPVVLRRRKKDFGEDIVKKVRQVVRVPLGTHQAATYRYHLQAKYLDCNRRPAICAKLQALRVASANPASHLLCRPQWDMTKGIPRSQYNYIPKVASAMELIAQILQRGEQVIVFSAFHDSLDALSARLNEAGVRHVVADGRMSQKKRGAASAKFKLGPPKATDRRPDESCSYYPVMLAGVECMAEGHSFHRCNNVILLCYSWAYDKFEQAINRAHRLNSLWDVNIYPIICEGSIDRKLEALIQEKGDAAELVLDGTLQEEQTAEVNLAELLNIAMQEFGDGKLKTIDEEVLERGWPALRAKLGRAVQAWDDLRAPMQLVEDEPILKVVFEQSEVTTESEHAESMEYEGLPLFVREQPKPEVIRTPDESFDSMPLWRQRTVESLKTDLIPDGMVGCNK